MKGESTLERCFAGVTAPTRRILDEALAGRDVSVADAVALSEARGPDLRALLAVADHQRRVQAGDVVTYVVNRNINFTNVCVKTCRFCAFSRELRSEQGYWLDVDEVVARALQARAMGATEICVQAGLAPDASRTVYVDLVRALKAAAPDMHLHAFSPEEVKYGAARARLSIREFLVALKEAGLDSLPGTSAEILDDAVRERIAPGRITTAQWIDVISTAHEIGLPTTSTMMFGHVESAADRARHLELLRRIQRDTGGFTEFVPLSFVHAEAPLFREQVGGDVPPGPTGDDILRLYAIARLMLGADFRNIQASWVKEGIRLAQWLLDCGVNDLGGTLINESISTAAGAQHGQLMTPRELRRVIRDAGRLPAQRNTVYEHLREFPAVEPPGGDTAEPLDAVEDPDATFGTYAGLAAGGDHRYDFDAVRAASRRGPTPAR